MHDWVGPAIIAAAISGLVSLIVVQLNFRTERRAEALRRAERIRDFQIALRAEVRSEIVNLSRFDLDQVYREAAERYETDSTFSVTVPRLTRHIVFDAIVAEIHILPERVIDPVVLYIRQRQAVESLAEDMRDASFRTMAPDRQLAMFRDYLGMWKVWLDLALNAEQALSAGGTQ